MLDIDYRKNEARDYVGPPKYFWRTVVIILVLGGSAWAAWHYWWPSLAKARRAAARQEIKADQDEQKAKYLGMPLGIADLPVDKWIQVSPNRIDVSEGDTEYHIYAMFSEDGTIRTLISRERLPHSFRVLQDPEGKRTIEP